MAFEIELKARLDGSETVKSRLSTIGSYLRSYKKSDTYWFPGVSSLLEASAMPGVRVRRESGIDIKGELQEIALVTYKKKEISSGIEVNEENEFAVSDAALFEELLNRLGLRKDINKEKTGWAWTIPAEAAIPAGAAIPAAAAGQPPILAELSQVTNLGWFLELEILTTNNDKQNVENCQKRLLALLENLEIPAERIEARPYTAMLREVLK